MNTKTTNPFSYIAPQEASQHGFNPAFRDHRWAAAPWPAASRWNTATREKIVRQALCVLLSDAATEDKVTSSRAQAKLNAMGPLKGSRRTGPRSRPTTGATAPRTAKCRAREDPGMGAGGKGLDAGAAGAFGATARTRTLSKPGEAPDTRAFLDWYTARPSLVEGRVREEADAQHRADGVFRAW